MQDGCFWRAMEDYDRRVAFGTEKRPRWMLMRSWMKQWIRYGDVPCSRCAECPPRWMLDAQQGHWLLSEEKAEDVGIDFDYGREFFCSRQHSSSQCLPPAVPASCVQHLHHMVADICTSQGDIIQLQLRMLAEQERYLRQLQVHCRNSSSCVC